MPWRLPFPVDFQDDDDDDDDAEMGYSNADRDIEFLRSLIAGCGRRGLQVYSTEYCSTYSTGTVLY